MLLKSLIGAGLGGGLGLLWSLVSEASTDENSPQETPCPKPREHYQVLTRLREQLPSSAGPIIEGLAVTLTKLTATLELLEDHKSPPIRLKLVGRAKEFRTQVQIFIDKLQSVQSKIPSGEGDEFYADALVNLLAQIDIQIQDAEDSIL